MTTINTEAANIIDKALDLIKPRFAWMRGNWGTTKTVGGKFYHCYCADGALNMAATGSSMVDPIQNRPLQTAKAAVATAINPNFDVNWGSSSSVITQWNDRKGRQKREVVRKLRKARRTLKG